MRNQKGVTLVALVVTIVVLLILAGTSLAMLKGENSMIGNGQKANYGTTEGEVMDKVQMAYNAINTEIIANSATITSYKAAETDNVINLANIAAKDLGGTGSISTNDGTSDTAKEKVGSYTIIADSTTVKIVYDDGKIFTGTTESTNNKPPFKQISYEITIANNGATLSEYNSQIIK